MSRLKSIVSVISLLLFLQFAPVSLGKPQADLKGKVTDVFGSRIADASLTLSRGRLEISVRTSADGTYSLRLEPGTYEMRVRGLGFCPMRRASFVLDPGAKATVDLELPTCAFDNARSPFSEEELSVQNLRRTAPLIQYGARKEKEDATVEYAGFVDQGKYFRTIFTDDLWTVRANKIEYDSVTRVLIADGDVTWQDGQTTRSAKSLELHLGKPTEVIKIVP
jgi:hypothetical protein